MANIRDQLTDHNGFLMDQLGANETFHDCEVSLRKPDTPIPLSLTCSVLDDRRGKPVRLVLIGSHLGELQRTYRDLDKAFGLTPVFNGQMVSNIVHAAEDIADHLTHFYMIFMLDFADPAYASEAWRADTSARFTAMKGTIVQDMRPSRAELLALADQYVPSQCGLFGVFHLSRDLGLNRVEPATDRFHRFGAYWHQGTYLFARGPQAETGAVAVQHIVRSIDPCMACTVH